MVVREAAQKLLAPAFLFMILATGHGVLLCTSTNAGAIEEMVERSEREY